MILLDYHNRVIFETLQERFQSDKPETVDIKNADFDGVVYHISTPVSKSKIVLSMGMRCFGVLETYGATAVLKKEYGEYLMDTPETGFEVSLCFDLETLPADSKERGMLTLVFCSHDDARLCIPERRIIDKSKI